MGLEVGVEEGVGLGAEAGGVRAGVERGGPRLDQGRLRLQDFEVARGPLAAEADRDGVGPLGLGHEPVAVEGDLGDGRPERGHALAEVGREPDDEPVPLEPGDLDGRGGGPVGRVAREPRERDGHADAAPEDLPSAEPVAEPVVDEAPPPPPEDHEDDASPSVDLTNFTARGARVGAPGNPARRLFGRKR